MMPLEISQRFDHVREHFPHMAAYALVDGVQYTRLTGARVTPSVRENRALFAGTEDAALAHAGPWLVSVATAGASTLQTISRLEQAYPSVLWLFSQLDMESLAQVLQVKLDARLPDGQIALMRFWDPRTLVALYNALDATARREYFSHVDEWHGQFEGNRFHITFYA
ncbi:DUF4123 domain-containing protein [Burkholderia sp. 22PA0099]|uniref:DUF4123 domain-containing protein n=1 Tax=Burkholderia sp. 22PA0099 TaxID=3237372 RepID=UPI0039C04845